MSPEEFIDKWRAVTVSEIAASQSHFNDLCALIDEPKPLDVDPTGERYAFEKHLFKLDGRPGRADVWKKGCFAWEYKRVGRYKSLAAAYGQLKEYSDALENPPLLIVCDISEIQIHTNFTNTVKVVHVIKLIDLNDPTKRRLLKHAFSNPQLLKPETTREQATNEAAREVAFIARKLRDAKNDPERVAHFLNKLVFCMFAEDIGLLPNYLFSELLEQARDHPENFKGMAETLFKAMQNKGSFFGTQRIPWFNGGLFADFEVLKLSSQQIQDLYRVALLDWSAIEPPIFGTLFERGLDPEKRTQLASLLGERKGGGVGIHYTDPDKIMKIVEPVVLRPLHAEWDGVKTNIRIELEKKAIAPTLSARTKYENNAREIYAAFLDRLGAYRVLDPACGSGNFLYVALLRLKDFEAEVLREAEAMGMQRHFPSVGPEAVMGIEINPYAAELARLVVWIGEIQWQLKTGYNFKREPILRPLNQIECRDALVNPDATEAAWPKADVIIGNPPFLGSRKMQPELGGDYVAVLRNVYGPVIPDGADLVCFWFHKAANELKRATFRVGLVATNSISGGKSREVIRNIFDNYSIYSAWADEPWAVDGASVRVALICFARRGLENSATLDGCPVDEIFPDLSARTGDIGVDLTLAKKLDCNAGIAFQGVIPRGSINRSDAERLGLPPASFVVERKLALELLKAKGNPNQRPNSDVVLSYIVGDEITNRPLNRYVIDFNDRSEAEAALYERPFSQILPVKSHRFHMNQPEAIATWWRHWNSRPKMRAALQHKKRYIATPRVSKYRVFRWVSSNILPDNMVVAIARDDYVTFGILQSRFHEQWSLRLCTFLGVGNDPRYTPSTTFETFPFPEGLEPDKPFETFSKDPRGERIARAGAELNALRETWLNPPELTEDLVDPEAGLSVLAVPIDGRSEQTLRARTLTKLYNQRPDWLIKAHQALDAAVADAYGWPADISDSDAMLKLLEKNSN